MEEEKIPTVVICSISNERNPKDLIRHILGVNDLPNPISVIENIEAYPWHIDTKYYDADIHLCPLETKTIANQAFAESVQAAVVIFDSAQENGLQQIEGWLAFIREFDPEIQMLVCDRCTAQVPPGDTGTRITKLQAQEWCLSHSFELIELDPSEDSDPEDEDDFRETTGVKRIIQSLHAHTWPNLIMKDRPNTMSEKLWNLLNVETTLKPSKEESPAATSLWETPPGASLGGSLEDGQSEAAEGQDDSKENDSQLTREDRIDSLLDKVPGILNADEMEFGSDQSFENLFKQFLRMKETAQGLPSADRKIYAEKVAVAFWRAMGGEEDEVSGLDSEEDET